MNVRSAQAPMWDLVEESLDEAEFLWRRWEAALSTHARDLAGVRFWVEERLLGSLDGLRAAGTRAYDPLLIPALEAEDPFRATAAAYALVVAGEPAGAEAIVAVVRHAKPERLAIFRRALELAPAGAALGGLERAPAKWGPEVTAVLLDIGSFQGRDCAERARRAATDANPLLQAAGLRALRHSPADPSLDLIQFHLDSADRLVREAAIETGLVVGAPAAWSRCRQIASRTEPGSDRTLLLLATLGDEREVYGLIGLLGDGTARKGALFALGFVGTRMAADACLEAMKDEELAKLAGEAFCAIVGLDLVKEGMVLPEPPPPDEPVPYEEEDLDADLATKPDDLLPRPDRSRLALWWQGQRGRFAPDQRHVGGARADLAALQHLLEHGPTRRRHATAAELAVRSNGRYQVETRAFCPDQQRQMRTFTGLGREAFRSPLARHFSAL